MLYFLVKHTFYGRNCEIWSWHVIWVGNLVHVKITTALIHLANHRKSKNRHRFTESVLYYGEKKLWINLLELFLFSTVGLQFGLRKKDSILDVFCEICEVLQDLSFTEDIWANASDFQQHFRHITCSISNKST